MLKNAFLRLLFLLFGIFFINGAVYLLMCRKNVHVEVIYDNIDTRTGDHVVVAKSITDTNIVIVESLNYREYNLLKSDNTIYTDSNGVLDYQAYAGLLGILMGLVGIFLLFSLFCKYE